MPRRNRRKLGKARSQVSELRSLVADLVNQFALEHTFKGQPVRSSGCLSDLETAFHTMGIPDPCPRSQWQGRLAAWVAGWSYDVWLLRQQVENERLVQKRDARG